MKTNRLSALAVAVSSVFALSATAGETAWWDVDFSSPTPNNVQLTTDAHELGALTNNGVSATAPYASGVWTAIDSDESFVTNEFNATGTFGADNCLRLDTQGNDLKWAPTNSATGVQTLVDVDLYLVGSDSAPTDFDANQDVQTAIYLKNLLDDDTQEVTNSVLCVYVWDENMGSGGESVWLDLAGAAVTNESWAHVKVTVDHSTANPMVSVTVNETVMHAVGDATSTSWPAANLSTTKAAGKISSISFRGTGAVDNFVGKTFEEEVAYYDFTAEVYIGTALQNLDDSGNMSRLAEDQEVKTGSTTTFDGFSIDNYESGEVTHYLDRIVILDPTDGTTVLETITYTYTPPASAGVSGQVVPDKDDSAYVVFDPDFFDDTLQGGPFTVTAPTEGAGADEVIVKIYFTDLSAPPAAPEVDVGDGLAAYKAAHPDADVPAPVAFNETTDLFEVSFVAPQTGRYVLMVCDTIDGTYVEDPGSAVNVATAGEPVTLTESSASNTAKFFKIGFGPAE